VNRFECLGVGFSKPGSLKRKVRLCLSLGIQVLTNLPVGQNLYQTNVLGHLRVSLLSYAYYVRRNEIFFYYAQFMKDTAVIYLHQFFTSLFRLFFKIKFNLVL
jgi:hypothetical protein